MNGKTWQYGDPASVLEAIAEQQEHKFMLDMELRLLPKSSAVEIMQ